MNTSIMIVEDEGLIAVDLKRKLEQAGYSVPLIADTATGLCWVLNTCGRLSS